MMRTSKLLLFCSVFSAVLSLDTSPAQASASACFENRLPVFQLIGSSKSSYFTKLNQIDTACGELERDEIMKQETFGEKAFNVLAGNISVGLTQGDAWASFAKLNGSAEQIRYRNELDRIRKIADPAERIRQVYALAAGASGKYDEETMGKTVARSGYYLGAHMPGHLIDHQAKTGSIGICREYAALLAWSLNQVARFPGSKSMALGPNDFSASLRYGFVAEGHAWVQAHLPQFSADGRLTGFAHVDLDTTWYSTFTPLFPRRALSPAVRERALRECREIEACM